MKGNRSVVLESDVKKAWKNDEFEIFLQPQINAENQNIEGFEALIRWAHPVHGILEPSEFLPIIRGIQMIERLDFLVFEKVCAFLHKRHEENKKLFCISCNFEREHFIKSNFVETLEKIRKRYRISAEYLAIEILEGKSFEEEKMVQANVAELNSLQYQVCLDDCGAADSVMSDLLFHSITHIKIDKKIVDHIERKNVQVLLQGLCGIAHRLSYRVVCEGVETKRQLELAKKCGVDSIQGFYFFKPMDTDRAEILYDRYTGI
ncbi:MAG: EAL domain-containing protein [Eubacteriales bacterium]|nr:EAL domain-containing protein [Eubacteriales bacterium]